jgi:hypothetical protein
MMDIGMLDPKAMFIEILAAIHRTRHSGRPKDEPGMTA